MKINMIKVAGGALLPADEEAETQMQRVKNCDHYIVDIKLNHNYKLLQKIHVFFKHCAQHYYGDVDVTVEQIELTRGKVTMAAGYVKQIFLPDGKRFELSPMSISYEKMTPDERAVCYDKLVNSALKNVFHSADNNTLTKLMIFF
jgi:hypothetical protein